MFRKKLASFFLFFSCTLAHAQQSIEVPIELKSIDSHCAAYNQSISALETSTTSLQDAQQRLTQCISAGCDHEATIKSQLASVMLRNEYDRNLSELLGSLDGGHWFKEKPTRSEYFFAFSGGNARVVFPSLYSGQQGNPDYLGTPPRIKRIESPLPFEFFDFNERDGLQYHADFIQRRAEPAEVRDKLVEDFWAWADYQGLHPVVTDTTRNWLSLTRRPELGFNPINLQYQGSISQLCDVARDRESIFELTVSYPEHIAEQELVIIYKYTARPDLNLIVKADLKHYVSQMIKHLFSSRPPALDASSPQYIGWCGDRGLEDGYVSALLDVRLQIFQAFGNWPSPDELLRLASFIGHPNDDSSEYAQATHQMKLTLQTDDTSEIARIFLNRGRIHRIEVGDRVLFESCSNRPWKLETLVEQGWILPGAVEN